MLFFVFLLLGLPDRSSPPVVGEPIWPKIPIPKKLYRKDGLPIWYYKDERLPLVTISIQQNGGTYHAENPQALKSASHLLRHGPRKKDWWSKKLAGVSGQTRTGVGITSSWAEIEVLQQHVDRGLRMLMLAILKPNYRHWEQEKSQTIKGMLRRQNTLSSIHYWALKRLVFGWGHPYSYIHQVDQLDTITNDDLKVAYHKHLANGISGVVVVGDISEDEAIKIINRRTSKLTFVSTPQKGINHSLPKWEPRTIIVDFPTEQQVGVTVLVEGLVSSDNQGGDLWYATSILGGGFSSRLSQNLRETNGLTYAIGASNNSYRDVGYIEISCTVSIEDVPQTIEEIHKEIVRMSTSLPTKQEFKTVVREIRAEVVEDLATSTSITRKLSSYQRSGYDPDGWRKRVQRRKAISFDNVQKVSKRVFSNPSTIVLLTGDGQQLSQVVDDSIIWSSEQIVSNEWQK